MGAQPAGGFLLELLHVGRQIVQILRGPGREVQARAVDRVRHQLHQRNHAFGGAGQHVGKANGAEGQGDGEKAAENGEGDDLAAEARDADLAMARRQHLRALMRQQAGQKRRQQAQMQHDDQRDAGQDQRGNLDPGAAVGQGFGQVHRRLNSGAVAVHSSAPARGNATIAAIPPTLAR